MLIIRKYILGTRRYDIGSKTLFLCTQIVGKGGGYLAGGGLLLRF